MSSNDAALIPRQYANPPVREAIFTVSLQEALPLNIVEDFCQAEWATQYYPQTLPVIEVALQMGETATATPTTQVLGRRLRAEEGQKTLLHVTKTQFAFHNFDKYLGWDKACAAFLEAWNQFVTHAGVSVQMASLGVRYINEIHLPKEAQSEPHLYLQLLPSVPAEFPQPDF